MSERTPRKEQASYTHGHHASVVMDHARRTAQDSAAFLLPHIQPHHKILDVGCGPGTITADLAALVPRGSVIAVDAVESVLQQASTYAASRNLTNISFQTVDANDLPFPDDTFDIVYCHQLLQHVKDPVGILREMRRVCKPHTGIVAAREADYASFAFYPSPPEINRWAELYQLVARKNGGEPNAGRHLHVWARQAGFSPDKKEIHATWDSWRYADERATQFSMSWHGRILQPGFMGTAVREGYASEEEIRALSEAWKRWGESEDVLVAIPHGEILCRKTKAAAH